MYRRWELGQRHAVGRDHLGLPRGFDAVALYGSPAGPGDEASNGGLPHMSDSQEVGPEDLYREVLAQGRCLEKLLLRLLEQRRQQPDQRFEVRAPATERLSPREQEILRLVATGRTNQQIGAEIRLSPGTVRNYVGRLFRKLGVSGRTQAAIRAIELGLVELDSDHAGAPPARERSEQPNQARPR
jgi:DNA-binding CsgD family transcriptional regulator